MGIKIEPPTYLFEVFMGSVHTVHMGLSRAYSTQNEIKNVFFEYTVYRCSCYLQQQTPIVQVVSLCQFNSNLYYVCNKQLKYCRHRIFSQSDLTLLPGSKTSTRSVYEGHVNCSKRKCCQNIKKPTLIVDLPPKT